MDDFLFKLLFLLILYRLSGLFQIMSNDNTSNVNYRKHGYGT
jgi:hypothetical protein